MSEEAKEYAFLCPKCHERHDRVGVLVDEYIDCGCGFRFYAFGDHGLNIVMTGFEAEYPPIASAMRRFVISTGRCQDIPMEMYIKTNEMPESDPGEELARTLEDFQNVAFGECYLTREMVESICESLQNGHDVELRKKKDGVSIIEEKKKNVTEGQRVRHSLPQCSLAKGYVLPTLASRGVFRIPGESKIYHE